MIKVSTTRQYGNSDIRYQEIRGMVRGDAVVVSDNRPMDAEDFYAHWLS